jgi:glycosyltransferase involved in cell wall biosynthesis
LTPQEAKKRLGVQPGDRTLLFFGRITPYKGVEYLIDAFRRVTDRNANYKLLIAGRVDRAEAYWKPIKTDLAAEISSGTVVVRDQFIPDEETEVYFKAADALVLPYKDIYQSGVLFLAHSFGLPVLAADVGSLSDDIIPGKTGLAFAPGNNEDMARVIEQYFASDLYANLDARRADIQEFTRKTHSWSIVAETTQEKYAELLQTSPLSRASLDLTTPS